jgi:integrase
MNIRACTNHGKKMFKVTVPNGVYPNGKVKYATLFRKTRTECKEAARSFNQEADAALKNIGTHSLGDVHIRLQKDWDLKVLNKEENPLAKDGIKQSTKIRYEDDIKSLFSVLPYGKDTALKIINKDWYDTFLNDMRTKYNFSKRQSKHVRAMLNNLLEKAEQLDWIVSPHHSFKKYTIDYTPKHVKSMTDKQAKRLYDELEQSFYFGHQSNSHGHYGHNSGNEPKLCESAFLMMIQYSTGIRWGEAAALCVEDFDWSNFTVKINKSRDYRDRSVSVTKAAHLRVEDANEGERIVPISSKLMKPFAKYVVKNVDKNSQLFTVSYTRCLELLHEKCKKVRIPDDIVDTKMFRRFIISQWQKMGVDPKTIAIRVGHNDTTTQNGYGTFSDPNALKDIKKLEAVLF